MAIKIFNGKTSSSDSVDFAGKISLYHQFPGSKNSDELEGFAFSEMDKATADVVAEMFDIDESDIDEGDKGFAVFTTELEVPVYVISARTQMIQFAASGPPVRICNGETQTDGVEEGEPCYCLAPKNAGGLGLTTVKECKKDRRACNPSSSALLQLAGENDPELGVWRIATGSVDSIESFAAFEENPDIYTVVTLTANQVRFEAKDGTNVSYSYPSLEVE